MLKHKALKAVCLCLCTIVLSQQTLLAGDPLNNVNNQPSGSSLDQFNQSNNTAQNLINQQNIIETFYSNGNIKQRDYLDLDNDCKVYKRQLFNIDGILEEQQDLGYNETPFFITRYSVSGSVAFEALFNLVSSLQISARTYYTSGNIKDYDEYDSFGRKTQSLHRREDGFISTIDIYDSTGTYVKATKVFGDYSALQRLDEFDEQGQLIKQTFYDEYGNPINQGGGNNEGLRETFYPNGNIKQRDFLDVENNNKVYKIHHFDINGVLTQQDDFNDQEKLTYVTRYNTSGAVIFESMFNVFTSLPMSARYYNDAGNLIAYETFDDFGKKKQTNHLNTNGSIASIDFYDATGVYVEMTKLFGDFSVLIRLNEFNSSGALIKQTDYNPQGLKTLVRVWAPEAGVHSRRFFYDENENIHLTADYDATDKVLYFKDTSVTSDPEATLISGSVASAQTATGLIASHPDDESFIYHDGIVQEWAKINAKDMAYTYDQALLGIAMVKSGNLAAAKKTLDFFNSQYLSEASFTGFWTVYDKDGGWKKYEYRKGMGENAWIAIFAMHYAQAATTIEEKNKATELALGITRWIASLPHFQGAVAMGVDAPGNPNWGTIYSVENMFDYYALLKGLSQNLPTASPDLSLINAEKNNLKLWLKNSAFDSTRNLFKKGGHTQNGSFVWDTHDALDVNSWAIQAVGAAELANEFSIDLQAMANAIANNFAVQQDGTFGGNVLTARGFDFSDLDNATAIRAQGRIRPALHWVEGTAGMIVSYYQIAAYLNASFSSGSETYEILGDHFFDSSMQSDVRTQNGSQVSYDYANHADVQVFFGTDVWKTAVGNSIASSIWMFFASLKFNPFDLN